MGLDMCLNANRYISPYKYGNPEGADQALGNKISEILGIPLVTDVDEQTGRVEGVKMRVGYWRKANAIHKWFIDHCSKDDVDDCRPLYVGREQLLELKATCEEVLKASELKEGLIHNGTPGKVVADATVAEEKLPTTSGFFFGNTDYDEYYIAYLKETIEIIDRALALDEKHWDFEYLASW